MKKTLAVLFGGISSEHEVSLASAAGVLKNCDTEKYTLLPVGITKTGEWILYGGDNYDAIADGTWENDSRNVRAYLSPDRTHHGFVAADRIIRADAVFPVMHGRYGEDGAVQGLLELSGIPYVGAGVEGCANAMNKTSAKIFADSAGILQAKWRMMYADDFLSRKEELTKELCEYMGLPIFVKPQSTGSSVGISKVKRAEDLAAAVAEARRYDEAVIFEETIVGRELEVGVLGTARNAVASCVGEICPSREFYTYSAKYSDGTSRTLIPADIPQSARDEIRRSALRIFEILNCSGLSRVDFFLRESDGRVVFNEINAIPGFTPISMYPKLFAASGIDYPRLIDRLVSIALEVRGNG